MKIVSMRIQLVFCFALLSFAAVTRAGETNAPAANASNNPVSSPEEADQAWKDVLRASQAPPPPKEWQGIQPTEEQRAEWRLEQGRLAGVAADKAKDFYTRYPDHAKAAV